jgi:hypothetical protein
MLYWFSGSELPALEQLSSSPHNTMTAAPTTSPRQHHRQHHLQQLCCLPSRTQNLTDVSGTPTTCCILHTECNTVCTATSCRQRHLRPHAPRLTQCRPHHSWPSSPGTQPAPPRPSATERARNGCVVLQSMLHVASNHINTATCTSKHGTSKHGLHTKSNPSPLT